MHDPLVVAHQLRRPFPSWPPRRVTRGPRWQLKLRHRCRPSCDHPPMRWGGFPPWKPSSYSSHWRLAGWEVYWPSLVTIWHREPGGHDSGTVCPHFYRWRGPGDKWNSKPARAWKWHVHHWSIQVPMLQDLRRALVERCDWCGGRSVRENKVNVSHSWDNRARRWWESTPGLYHSGCSSAVTIEGICLCDVPIVDSQYSMCERCGKHYGTEASWLTYRRAVEVGGLPVRGRSWRWPREVKAEDIKRELAEARGEQGADD